MLLIVDMGNTSIQFALQPKKNAKKLKVLGRIPTDRDKHQIEYVCDIRNLLQQEEIQPAEIAGCVMSSTVPALSTVIIAALKMILECEVMQYTAQLPCGITIRRENPATLGSDIVAGMVGAGKIGKAPYIVVDMGTCTTLAVVNREGEYVGGAIMPGVLTAYAGLQLRAPHLPDISFAGEKQAIGTDSMGCIESGVIIGHAKAVEGLVKQSFSELGYEGTVIVTGGVAEMVGKYMDLKCVFEPDLVLQGLALLYKMHRNK